MIESTYFHTMSVSRNQETENEWGTTVQGWSPVDNLQGINCAFSQSSRNNTNSTQTSSNNVIEYNPKIFCAMALDIKPGDRITVTYKTRNLGVFVASQPYYYESHQEIPLLRECEA